MRTKFLCKRQRLGNGVNRRSIDVEHVLRLVTEGRGHVVVMVFKERIHKMAVMIAVLIKETAAGFQYAHPFLERPFRMRQIPQHIAGDDGVEGFVGKRERCGVALTKRHISPARLRILMSVPEHFRAGVAAISFPAASGSGNGQKRRSAANVEHRTAGRNAAQIAEQPFSPMRSAGAVEFVSGAQAVAFGTSVPVAGNFVAQSG